jgi:hypothetical protein
LINIFFGFGVWFMLSEHIMFAFFEPKLAGTIVFEGVDDSSNVIVNHGASMIMNWTLVQEKDVLRQVAGSADSLSA